MLELDELTAGVPTPRPTPSRAYTEGDKALVLGKILSAWLDVPGMRPGQLLYAAAVYADKHVSQIKDKEFAEAVEKWAREYR